MLIGGDGASLSLRVCGVKGALAVFFDEPAGSKARLAESCRMTIDVRPICAFIIAPNARVPACRYSGAPRNALFG